MSTNRPKGLDLNSPVEEHIEISRVSIDERSDNLFQFHTLTDLNDLGKDDGKMECLTKSLVEETGKEKVPNLDVGLDENESGLEVDVEKKAEECDETLRGCGFGDITSVQVEEGDLIVEGADILLNQVEKGRESVLEDLNDGDCFMVDEELVSKDNDGVVASSPVVCEEPNVGSSGFGINPRTNGVESEDGVVKEAISPPSGDGDSAMVDAELVSKERNGVDESSPTVVCEEPNVGISGEKSEEEVVKEAINPPSGGGDCVMVGAEFFSKENNGINESSLSVVSQEPNAGNCELVNNPETNEKKYEDGVVNEAIFQPYVGNSDLVNNPETHEKKFEDGIVKEAISQPSRVGVKDLETTELAEESKNMGKKRGRKRVKPLVGENQVSYSLTSAKEGEFSINDMVWGKVKSHPWWPGQIFDPSDASELAMKHHKEDRLLVAYFGDQSFAWVEASSLKSFKTHFLEMEKQTNVESFCNAVDCSLDEVLRRVELGLSCSCMTKDVNSHAVTNSGIREGTCRRDYVENYLSTASFEPDKLLDYVRALALYPGAVADRLELVIAQAQLTSFHRLNGNFQMPEFHVYEGLAENDAYETPVSKDSRKARAGKRKLKSGEGFSQKRHNIPEDGLIQTKKEKSLTDLMSGDTSPPNGVNSVNNVTDNKGAIKSSLRSSGQKCKTRESFPSDSSVNKRKQKTFHSDTELPRSLKIGDRISRIANQLTGSPLLFNSSSEIFAKSADQEDGSSGQLQDVDVDFSPNTPQRYLKQKNATQKENSSPYEMFSQLCFAAQNPMKRSNVLSEVVVFFTGFRKSVYLDNSSSARRKKSLKQMSSSETAVGNKNSLKSKRSCIEAFDYENVSDSYWTDRIIQISPEDQQSRRKQKRKADLQLFTSSVDHKLEQHISVEFNSVPESKTDTSTVDPKGCFQPDPKKQNPDEDSNLVIEKTISGNKDAGDSSPTMLVLIFNSAECMPIESELNRIFTRFGPLKESETQILKETNRARVVFQRRSDAEVAFSSAGKFSTFGPALVRYQLTYLSSTPPKPSPRTTRQSKRDAARVEGSTS